METLNIAQEISAGYNNAFVNAKNEIVEIPVCPEGFERILLGKKLQIPVCISKAKFDNDDALADIDTGISPLEYFGGVPDVDAVMQRQKDGRVILAWHK